MGLHVFVDEVKERGYLVTAAALLSGELAPARRIVQSLVMPRQRRLHFNKESDGRRKQIIDALLEIAPQVTIYDTANQPRQRQRDACLRLLVADAAAVHVDKLVLERDDSVVEADRRLLFDEVRRLGYSSLHYVHLRGHE